MKRILVTGATGFVGSYICSKLLEDENNFLYVIARKKRMRTAQDRVLDAIAKCNEKVNIMDVKSRIKVFEGDIEEEQLGLSSQEYTCLKEEINVIYHSAASIKFSLDYEDAKKINCGGTQKIVALMKEIHPEQFERLNYISTAYVAGDYRKGFKETDLDVNQVFNNTYEQSKYACEQFLNSCMREGWPITIYRPSIVCNESEEGATHPNNIVYKFMKMLSKGIIEKFYCDDSSSINIVPVNYFVDGMIRIAQQKESVYKTYHLVNGTNVNVKSFVEETCKNFGVRVPEFVEFSKANPDDVAKNALSYFFTYVRLSHEFDSEYTQKCTSKENIICAEPNEEYISKMVSYLVDHKMV